MAITSERRAGRPAAPAYPPTACPPLPCLRLPLRRACGRSCAIAASPPCGCPRSARCWPPTRRSTPCTLVAYTSGGGSSTAVSLLFLAFLGPAILLSAPAGVFVDRFDRRDILFFTNIVRAVAFGGLLLAPGNLPVTYLLIIVTATATTFFIPAEAAMIPRVATPSQLHGGQQPLHLHPPGGLRGRLRRAADRVRGCRGAVRHGRRRGADVLRGGGPLLDPALARPEAVERRGRIRDEFREGIDVARRDAARPLALALLGFTASLIGVVGVLGPQVAVRSGLTEREFVLLVLPLAVGLVGAHRRAGFLRAVDHRRLCEPGSVGWRSAWRCSRCSGPDRVELAVACRGPSWCWRSPVAVGDGRGLCAGRRSRPRPSSRRRYPTRSAVDLRRAQPDHQRRVRTAILLVGPAATSWACPWSWASARRRRSGLIFLGLRHGVGRATPRRCRHPRARRLPPRLTARPAARRRSARAGEGGRREHAGADPRAENPSRHRRPRRRAREADAGGRSASLAGRSRRWRRVISAGRSRGR